MPPSDGFYAIMTTYRRSSRRCAGIVNLPLRVLKGSARRTLAQLFQKAPQSCASTGVFVGGVLSTLVALAMEINLRLAWVRPVGVFIAPRRAACLSSLKSVILENEKSNTEG
jgi:hypothetical protein